MGSTADTSYKSTGGRLTKISSIPAPPSNIDKDLKQYLLAVKETIEVREGQRGNSLDRSIVVRDLLDSDFTNKYWPGGTANPNTSIPESPTPQLDTKPPGPVTNFALDQSNDTFNILSWTNPTDDDLYAVDIYAWSPPAGSIPLWTNYLIIQMDDLVRYMNPVSGILYVYRCIDPDPEATGATSFTNITPEDPEHGFEGTGVRAWRREAYPYAHVGKAGIHRIAVLSDDSESFSHNDIDPTKDYYYWARARDVSSNASLWAPSEKEGLLAYAKTSTHPPPNPTGFCICETGSKTEFNDLHVSLCWDPSTQPGVTDYEVQVIDTDTGTLVRTQEAIRNCKWTYSLAENKYDHGGTAIDRLTFRLWAVSAYQEPSPDYQEISVYNPAPSTPTGLGATVWMYGIEFRWACNPEPDIDFYRYRIQVESEAWSGWYESPSIFFAFFLSDAQRASYPDGALVTIQVYAVDTWGNQSAGYAEASGTTDILYVEPKDIDSFAIDASKLFLKIPILQYDTWINHTPNTISVKWYGTEHSVYYAGQRYKIAEGYTDKKYIYWTNLFKSTGSGTQEDPYISYYASSNTHPGDADLLGNHGFIIAVNIDGAVQMAWNAIANQVIGSAYIMDGAINNAHIGNAEITDAKVLSLTAPKIIGGMLMSQQWRNTGGALGSAFSLDGGGFCLGGTTGWKLWFDSVASVLYIRGAIMQSAAGTTFPFPIYRGEWASGTTYYKGDLVTYNGSTWAYVSDTATAGSIPSASSTYWDLWAAVGSPIAYRGEWSDNNVWYYSTFGSRRDVVKYSGAYYICRETHQTIPGSDPLDYAAKWEAFGATFTSIATGLLLAEDATINRALVLGYDGAPAGSGILRSYGKTGYGYNCGEGFWLGHHAASGTYRLDIGNDTSNMRWDGTCLRVNGIDVLNEGALQSFKPGGYVLAESKAVNYAGQTYWKKIKSFILPRGGTVTAKWDMHAHVGSAITTQIRVNGTPVGSTHYIRGGDAIYVTESYIDFNHNDEIELWALGDASYVNYAWVDNFRILSDDVFLPTRLYENGSAATYKTIMERLAYLETFVEEPPVPPG